MPSEDSYGGFSSLTHRTKAALRIPYKLQCILFIIGLMTLLFGISGCDLAPVSEEQRFALEYGDSTFFVSPLGSDAWSGQLCCPNADSTDGPFATFSRARVASRNFSTDTLRRIIVRGGVYYDVSFELYAKDSNLTIETVDGEEAILYGGHLVTGWIKEDDGEFWSAKLPGVREGRWEPRMLQVNDRFCPRARLPVEGAFIHRSVFDVQWMGATNDGWARRPTPEELTTLKYREEDLGPWLEVQNAELTIYHAWDESTVGVKSIDPEKHVITFSNPAGHPPGAFASWNPHAQTYIVSNIREGMTRPGQWYLDKLKGSVIYWPLPGEDMEDIVAIVPTTESIIHLSNLGGGAVRNLTIRGLTLSVTTTPLMSAGFGAENLHGAISSDATLIDCRFEDLKIQNVAGHGIKLRNPHNRSVTIEDCEVDGTGAGGIYLTGQESLITENLITHVGSMYPGAIGIFGGGDHNVISHNDVYSTSYTGINGGGGTGNRIEYNDIARVMQVLNDGAAIYTIFARDLVVQGNVVRDIEDASGGRHAYYLDEQSENCVVVDNLAVGVPSPLQNHWARNNRIEHNVFVVEGDMALRFVRSTGYAMSGNVLYATGKIQIHNTGAIETFQNNIFYSLIDQVEGIQYRPDSYNPMSIDEIYADDDNDHTDPMFLDLLKEDFRFSEGSPAYALGIAPLDVSQAGRTNE